MCFCHWHDRYSELDSASEALLYPPSPSMDAVSTASLLYPCVSSPRSCRHGAILFQVLPSLPFRQHDTVSPSSDGIFKKCLAPNARSGLRRSACSSDTILQRVAPAQRAESGGSVRSSLRFYVSLGNLATSALWHDQLRRRPIAEGDVDEQAARCSP